MARGNSIIVSTLQASAGDFTEGIVAAGETPKPGTIMQKDTSVALQGGRHTYKIYNRGTDGHRPAGAMYILLEDMLQGRLATTAYAAGERCFLYALQKGDEVNALIANVSGTADITKGTLMSVDDATGKLIAASGQESPFLLLETIVDNAADQLGWVSYGG